MTYEFFSCVSSSTIWLLWQLHFDNYWFDLDSICSYLKRLCWAWNETGCHWPPWWSGTQVFVEVGNCTSQYFSAQLYWVNLGVTFFTLIFLLWKHNLISQRVIHIWCTDILVLWGSELDGFLFFGLERFTNRMAVMFHGIGSWWWWSGVLANKGSGILDKCLLFDPRGFMIGMDADLSCSVSSSNWKTANNFLWFGSHEFDGFLNCWIWEYKWSSIIMI